MDKPVYETLAAALRNLHRQGFPGWVNYHFIEASANVAMFIPLGILTAMAMPSQVWWKIVGLGLLASACMEFGQFLFSTARFSSPTDVVTNTLGAVIGVSTARLMTRRKVIGAH